jgi:hypothetical protein
MRRVRKKGVVVAVRRAVVRVVVAVCAARMAPVAVVQVAVAAVIVTEIFLRCRVFCCG